MKKAQFTLALLCCFLSPFLIAKQALNEISAYCGKDCEKCKFSKKVCFDALSENLSYLCADNDEKCFALWQQLSKTCNTCLLK